MLRDKYRFVIERNNYSATSKFLTVKNDYYLVRLTIEVVAGGFLAAGRRKPVKTLREAIKQGFESQLRSIDRERQLYQGLSKIVLAKIDTGELDFKDYDERQ